MLTLLYSVGVIVLIISIIAGIYSGAFMGFLISVAGGIASAIIFFALAKILENQEAILHKLIHQEETQSKHHKQEKKYAQGVIGNMILILVPAHIVDIGISFEA